MNGNDDIIHDKGDHKNYQSDDGHNAGARQDHIQILTLYQIDEPYKRPDAKTGEEDNLHDDVAQHGNFDHVQLIGPAVIPVPIHCDPLRKILHCLRL